jgi:hypothetical protein
MKNLLIAFTLILAAVSCENATPNPDDLRSVEFMPTSCAEPWDAPVYTVNKENRSSRLVAYLKASGIKNVYDLSSINDGMVYCQACTCPSGEVFTFDVTSKDYEKLKQLDPFDKYLETNQ